MDGKMPHVGSVSSGWGTIEHREGQGCLKPGPRPTGLFLEALGLSLAMPAPPSPRAMNPRTRICLLCSLNSCHQHSPGHQLTSGWRWERHSTENTGGTGCSGKNQQISLGFQGSQRPDDTGQWFLTILALKTCCFYLGKDELVKSKHTNKQKIPTATKNTLCLKMSTADSI